MALSGGGFRAAFFHVGVLARLAETDVLRRVEVISTVSGGSIVGAAYYVLLKHKLEETPDGQIGRDGYVALVADLESRLRTAVQKNIRGRVFGNLLKNAAMALQPSYSRSDRIGDLYDRHLYKPAWGERPRKWRGFGPERQIELRELLITPKGTTDFHPETGNRDREEKVPVLLVNATSLNSGHNWRFEAVCMGESLPDDSLHAELVGEVDTNMRLERAYFEPGPGQWRVPERQQDFPLALAVAASAGVPGVFQPLSINGMYEDVTVQLVDGGVQDNQGVQGLFDKRCTHLIVSDASGLMGDVEKPSARIPGVVARSGSISRDRVRDEQLIGALEGPYRARALMHLRKGLAASVVAPGTSPADAAPGPDNDGPDNEYDTDDFEVAASVQNALSRIRTDLDYFSDVEASSLELDGYLMSAFELKRQGFEELTDGDAPPVDASAWTFGDAALRAEIAAGDRRVRRALEAGKRKFMRFAWLRPGTALLMAIVILAALGAAVFAVGGQIGDLLADELPLGAALAALLLIVLVALGYALDPRWRPIRALVELAMAMLLTLAALPLFAWAQLSVLATRVLYER